VPRSRDIAAELPDECLNQEIFYSLKEAQVVVQQWRSEYNTIRPTLIARISATGAANIHSYQPN
jgi:hypothetical protein